MAAQKKKTVKKTSKSKAESQSENSSLSSLVTGWLLFAIGFILLVGSISSVYSGSEGNWLGPIFGDLIPQAFIFFFGKLPVVVFTLAVMLWGLFMSIQPIRGRILGVSIGMTLLTLDLSCLLSLKNYGLQQLSRDTLSVSGGLLGQFFSQNIAIPVFGTKSCIAPALILIAVLVLILVLSFGLRPRHFNFLVQGYRWVMNVVKNFREGRAAAKENAVADEDEESPKRRGISMAGDTTIFTVPDDYKTKEKGVLKPFSARSNWMEQTVSSEGETMSGTSVPFTDTGVVEPPQPAWNGEGEDPEIARLEQLLRDGEGRMNALEIMEVKNKIAALRRARDIINWEKGHDGRLVVKGAVRGDPSSESQNADDATVVVGSDATVVAGADSQTMAGDDATMVAGSEDATMVAGSFNEETDNAESSEEDFVPDSSDDETFVPQVVTSDEVGEDPTYVPPNQIGTSASKGAGTSSGIPQPDETAKYDEYKVPAVADILSEHEPQSADYTEDELNAIGRMLEEKLENFKIKGKVVGCETGPVITRFEVEPGPGVKVSQFSALQDDLAMALKAMSIRILAPIPGKGAVGIEIPNRKTQTIYGRDIFESSTFSPSSDKIMMALGKDISGEPFAMDLAKAPHLMIAGQTGSGKSVCINALMASMLFSKTPDELRMILVDPKAVELKMYENIPHLLAPVITKPEVAIQALQWLCYEMDRRTEVLAQAKVRNLLGFNEKFEAGELPPEVPEEDRSHRMAFIVVIIDEMADLMMVAGKEIEKNVSRLAAKARAVGIHLVLATQRPSVKVITGNIKANLPTRISFKVASQVDARTVMDHAGAEKLLGRGDMLYKAVNAPDPIRVHGAFLSDEEAEKLADACSNQNVFYPQLETFDVEGVGEDGEDGDGNAALNEKQDKLLFDVAQWAIECGNGVSTSAVQRHFSVGYSRAGKIVDQLYGLGICGRSTGNSKPRALLISMEELMQMERSGVFR